MRQMTNPMTFTPEQLKQHDALVRQELRSHIVTLIENYAEGCRRQALAQGIDSNTDLLRGAVEASRFLASVLSVVD